jgi:hypothetical protein
MVVHTCNSGTWETEAGGFRVRDQPCLHIDTFLKKTKTKKVGKRREKLVLEEASVDPGLFFSHMKHAESRFLRDGVRTPCVIRQSSFCFIIPSLGF